MNLCCAFYRYKLSIVGVETRTIDLNTYCQKNLQLCCNDVSDKLIAYCRSLLNVVVVTLRLLLWGSSRTSQLRRHYSD